MVDKNGMATAEYGCGMPPRHPARSTRQLPLAEREKVSWGLEEHRIERLRAAPSWDKYYLTQLGRRVLLAALHLRQALLIPTLGGPIPTEV